jgi:hemerythrin-like domain-containing protein
MRIVLLRLAYFTFGLLIFCTCQPKLSQEEFLQWVNNYNNGLHVKHTFNGVVYDAQYLPPQARNSLHKNPDPTTGLQHITLRIVAQDGTDVLKRHATSAQDVQLNEYYYSYLFQEHIFLEQGDSLLPCALFHFERNVDQTNSRVFNLAFENEEETQREFFLIIKSDRLSAFPVRIKFTRNTLPDVKRDS